MSKELKAKFMLALEKRNQANVNPRGRIEGKEVRAHRLTHDNSSKIFRRRVGPS